MDEIFAAVEGRPKRRQGITGQTIEAQMRGTMCQITEYELDVLRDALIAQAAKLAEADADVALSRIRADARRQALQEALDVAFAPVSEDLTDIYDYPTFHNRGPTPKEVRNRILAMIEAEQ